MSKLMKKALVSASFLALLSPTLTSCSSTGDYDCYIYALNAEDYIDEELLTSFEDMVYERDGKRVKVVYETYDTNETMYNTLKTGKQTYDLICCSDYMIQRLAREGMATSFHDAINRGLMPNYVGNVSSFLASYDGSNSGKLDTISVDLPNGEKDTLNYYAVGYMWGTLGILYNPSLVLSRNYNLFANNDRYKDLTDEEKVQQIISDFESLDGYSYLWDPLFKGTQSIKDSMRDTYAVGIFEYYKDYFDPNSSTYLTNYKDRNEQFNKCDDETIEGVQNTLIDLKENIFGFEVDSGKDDIVTQKIAVNIAWSGDAVNSIGRGFYADEDWVDERPDEEKVNLYYTIPEIGANIWFDAWCLPTHDEAYYQSDEYLYSIEFLDYLNDPANAVDNMSYNGYTSFIGSNSANKLMLNYILYSYDTSDGDGDDEGYDLYDISYYFDFVDKNGEPLKELEITVEDPWEEEEDGRVFTYKDEDGDGKLDIKVKTDLDSYEGRSLVAQYPETKNIDYLYVMRDFGDQNNAIVSMWENVKVNPLPVWVVVILIIFLVGFVGYLGSYKLIRKYKLKKRKELRKESETN